MEVLGTIPWADFPVGKQCRGCLSTITKENGDRVVAHGLAFCSRECADRYSDESLQQFWRGGVGKSYGFRCEAGK